MIFGEQSIKKMSDFSFKEESERGQEQKESNNKYGLVSKLRDEKYFTDSKISKKAESMLPVLETHNKIVEKYLAEIIEPMLKRKEITFDESVIATIAGMLHDAGKLNSELLEHHQKSSEYAQDVLDQITKKKIKINQVDLSKSIQVDKKIIPIKEKIKQAIERHMNHPFLVAINNGQRFPNPQDNIDKIVFDADMLANIGFKNIAFKLIDLDRTKKDKEIAEQKKISYIQAVFDDVINAEGTGVKELSKIVLTKQGKTRAKELIEQVTQIYNNLDFTTIQKRINNEKLDAQAIKKLLNEEIKRAGKQFSNIDDFIM